MFPVRYEFKCRLYLVFRGFMLIIFLLHYLNPPILHRSQKYQNYALLGYSIKSFELLSEGTVIIPPHLSNVENIEWNALRPLSKVWHTTRRLLRWLNMFSRSVVASCGCQPFPVWPLVTHNVTYYLINTLWCRYPLRLLSKTQNNAENKYEERLIYAIM